MFLSILCRGFLVWTLVKAVNLALPSIVSMAFPFENGRSGFAPRSSGSSHTCSTPAATLPDAWSCRVSARRGDWVRRQVLSVTPDSVRQLVNLAGTLGDQESSKIVLL